MNSKFEDSEWTDDEMFAIAARAFDEADTATPIPTEPIANSDDLEYLALSRSPEFNPIFSYRKSG